MNRTTRRWAGPAASLVAAALTATALTATPASAARTDLSAAAGAAADPYGYLMVHFLEDSAGYAEKIYLDVSNGDDATSWTPLNGGKPILANDLGSSGVRDPYLVQNPETGTYYILGTDLRVFNQDGAKVTDCPSYAPQGYCPWYSYKHLSRDLVVWQSDDLVSWSKPRTLRVAGDTAGRAWAPEATWVDDYDGAGHGSFVVYWSSNVFDPSDTAHTGAAKSDTLYGFTSDFTQGDFDAKNPDGAQVMYEASTGDVIDTSIHQYPDADGELVTYRAYKQNGGDAGNPTGITFTSTTASDWWKEGTSWKVLSTGIGSAEYGSVEAPLFFKENGADRWYLYVDQYGGSAQGYRPYRTDDIAGGQWTSLGAGAMAGMKTNTKHGGVLPLTKAAYDRVRAADVVGATDPSAVTTQPGTAPTLPATVEVTTSDGATRQAAVTWDDVDAASYAHDGRFTVEGHVAEGYPTQLNGLGSAETSMQAPAGGWGLEASTPLTVAADVVVGDGGDADADLVADLSFDDEASGLAGAGAKATVNGTFAQEDGPDGTKAVRLGSTDWLNVTKQDGSPLLAGLDDVTISYDSKPDATGNTGWSVFAAPSTATQTYQKEHYLGVMDKTSGVTVERYDNAGTRDTTGNLATTAANTGWKHVDLVLSGATGKLYVDGALAATSTTGKNLSTILGASGGVLQVGKANWTSGEYFSGLLDNLEIRSSALSQAAIQEAAARRAYEQLPAALTIEDTSYVLPGAKGLVTWTSQTDAVVIADDGRTARVTRPAPGSPATTGTLTASVSLGGTTLTKQVEVTITAPPSDDEKAQQALDAIDVPGLDDVRTSLTLPTTGKYGLDIAWRSSDPAVISDSTVDGVAPGVVVRGTTDRTVTLTATVLGKSRELTAVVRTKVATPKTTDYLFAHFTGTEGSATDEQIYFATSSDGASWTDTRANGDPVLSSQVGDKGVRDPYLVRSPEGDTFYLIATDLSIYHRGGWGAAQATTTGSLKLVVWESHDLVHWTEPRLTDVASKIPGAGMAWAPEAFWDAAKQQYVVYWATASSQANELGDVTDVYYATTRDFRTFSTPVKWIDRTGSIIDTTMIKVGDWYYRASGDGQITIERSKNLYATSTAATAEPYTDDDHWSLVGTLSSIFGSSAYSGSYLEGPELFQYNQDDWSASDVPTWGLMADQYAQGKGYLPFRTTNIADASTSSWSTASDVNFGGLKKRHGTILPITSAELAAVQKATVGTTGTLPVDEPDDAATAEQAAAQLALPYVLQAGTTLPADVAGASVTWKSSDAGLVAADGAVLGNADGEGLADATVTATVTLGDASVTKPFQVKVSEQHPALAASYTRTPAGKLNSSLHLALSTDGKKYTALNQNEGVLFARSDFGADPKNGVSKQLVDPYVFRLKDGTFGVIATQTNAGEAADPTDSTKALVFTSPDLVTYTEKGLLDLGADAAVSKPAAEYDAEAGVYRVTWSDPDGTVWGATTTDLSSVSTPERSARALSTVPATGVDGAKVRDGVVLTRAEGEALRKRLTQVTNTTVDAPAGVDIAQGAPTPAATDLGKVTARYSDGSTAQLSVAWDADDLAKVDTSKPGTYPVSGTVRTVDTFPLFDAARADPDVFLYDGKYYFVATTESEGQKKLYMYESDTLDGLGSATPHLIQNDGNLAWAPEVHEIGGHWYLNYARGSVWNQVKSTVVRLKDGGDPTNADDWDWANQKEVRLRAADGSATPIQPDGITLDMTYFEVGGTWYAMWSDRVITPSLESANLEIATFDPADPSVLTSAPVVVSRPDTGWDNNTSPVDEGPNALVHDGKVVVTFSGSGVDTTYVLGTLTADADADLLDPASWTKSNAPVLSSANVSGQAGPGHNAFFTDTDGTLIMAFHARGNGRQAGIRAVHWGVDGNLVLDMTADRQVLPANRDVTATVTVLPGDVTRPTVALTTSPAKPDGSAGWFVSSPVTVTATGADDKALASTEISVDGGAWVAGASASTAVASLADGRHVVQGRATDAAGNVAQLVSRAVLVDSAPAVSNAAVDTKARTVTLRAQDTTSGVARVEYRVGTSGAWKAYSAPVKVGSAAATVQYRAVDVAGNVEATNAASVPAAGVVLKSTSTAAVVSPSTVTFGTAAKVTIRVTGAGGTPSGSVRVTDGKRLVGSAKLAGGRATVTLAKDLSVGSHTLTVTYSGDKAFAASSDTVNVNVTKTSSRTLVKVNPKAPTHTQRATVTATVKTVQPTGTVTVKLTTTVKKTVVTHGKKVTTTTTRTVVSKKVALSKNGTATLRLPKLAKGAYRVTVTYGGSATATASGATTALTVRR